MKPKNLKYPFLETEPRTLFQDRVLYVPERAPEDRLAFPTLSWKDPEWFGNENPVCLEYCSGNGSWITAKAKEDVSKNWIALEKRFMRVRKIWSKIKNQGVKNLISVCGEALNTTERYFPDASIDYIFINFPDPWPKKRHAKNRLIQQPFIDQVTRILRPGGELIFVTDDQPYSEQAIELLSNDLRLTSLDGPPYYIHELPGYGTSYFEELWRDKGRKIYYHRFQRNTEK